MKILITGASGFVGTHLSNLYLSEGHTVYGLVRTPKKMQITHSNFHLVKGDLNTSDLPWMNELPADIDVCVHTAGLVHTYLHDEFYQVNVDGTKYLVDQLKKKYVQLKFILISSLAAAGPSIFDAKKTEDDPDFPVSHYGWSKKKAEDVLKGSAPKSWQVSIIRPPMIIGPGDVAVLDIFKMVKSKVIILPGVNSLKKQYSFVCVFDLVTMIKKVSEGHSPDLYYCSHDEIISFKKLISIIKKELKVPFLIYLPIPFFIVKVLSFFLNVIYKIKVHNIRLTPDKIYELKALAWTCDSQKSKERLQIEYAYDIQKTVAVTADNYKKLKWI